jgi:hypothetical protein
MPTTLLHPAPPAPFNFESSPTQRRNQHEISPPPHHHHHHHANGRDRSRVERIQKSTRQQAVNVQNICLDSGLVSGPHVMNLTSGEGDHQSISSQNLSKPQTKLYRNNKMKLHACMMQQRPSHVMHGTINDDTEIKRKQV